MPSFTSKFFYNKQNQQQCCACGCHEQQAYNNSNTRPKWFPRIRRRSSSASSSTNSLYDYQSASSSSSSSSRRPSTEYMIEIEEKQMDEFENLYKLALDEMDYAIESQGSIYYHGDLITATEAVDNCLDKFQYLLQILHSDRSYKFQQEWTNILFDLRSRLDSLPFVAASD